MTNTPNKYAFSTFKRWTPSAIHCYESGQDCATCTVPQALGWDFSKNGQGLHQCHMPESLGKLLENSGPPHEVSRKPGKNAFNPDDGKYAPILALLREHGQMKSAQIWEALVNLGIVSQSTSKSTISSRLQALRKQGLTRVIDSPSGYQAEKLHEIIQEAENA